MMRKFIFHRSLVTDGWVSLDPADTGLVESVYKKNIREGEERLMLAVLESAVEDFQEYVLAKDGKERKLFQEAEEWFFAKESDQLFSFEYICEILRLAPAYIRRGLLSWKEAKLKTHSAEGHHQGRTKLATTRMRHPSVRLSKTA